MLVWNKRVVENNFGSRELLLFDVHKKLSLVSERVSRVS